jgi:hypothetical protein
VDATGGCVGRVRVGSRGARRGVLDVVVNRALDVVLLALRTCGSMSCYLRLIDGSRSRRWCGGHVDASVETHRGGVHAGVV